MDEIVMLAGRGPYLGARLGMRATSAARALSTFADEMRARTGHPSGAWALDLAGGRLVVRGGGEPIEAPPGTWTWPLRRFGGMLIAGAIRRCPIEIELLPWSDTACELGIRPSTWPPRALPSARWYALAEETLVTIGGEIFGWADALGRPVAA